MRIVPCNITFRLAKQQLFWVVLLIGWSKFSTSQKHFPDLGSDTWSISMEFPCSFLRRHFPRETVVASLNVGCFLRRTAVVSPEGVRHDLSRFARCHTTLYNMVEPISPRCWLILDSTCAVTVFPCLFLFLRLKERQIHMGWIDLVWANCHGANRPDTVNTDLF